MYQDLLLLIILLVNAVRCYVVYYPHRITLRSRMLWTLRYDLYAVEIVTC